MSDQHKTKTDHNGGGQVFDVMRPGKAPVPHTSKPVIVGHKPEVKDEMIGGNTARIDAPHDTHPLMNHTQTIPSAPEVPPSKLAENPAKSAPSIDLDEALAGLASEAPAEPPIEAASAPKTGTPRGETDSFTDTTDTEEPSAAQSPHTETTPQVAQPTVQAPEPPEPEASPPAAQPSAFGEPSQDQLVADTGAPILEPGSIVVSHHGRRFSWVGFLLAILIGLAIGLLVLDILLDGDVIKTVPNVPHTNLLQ